MNTITFLNSNMTLDDFGEKYAMPTNEMLESELRSAVYPMGFDACYVGRGDNSGNKQEFLLDE